MPPSSSIYKPSPVDRYVASMVLSGVGDALGYKNGEWEFCHSGPVIHKELKELGGLSKIDISRWKVSDDTVLHLATAEGLISAGDSDMEDLLSEIAQKYMEGMTDMIGRAPGATTMNSVRMLKPNQPKGYTIPFNRVGGGCGAAMRSMCIGLRYPSEKELDKLIKVSVESGRMTHHHPTGYLGSFAGALFTAYAVQEKPVSKWGSGLMKTLEEVKKYIISEERDVKDNLAQWTYFSDRWEEYLKKRELTTGDSDPVFPVHYGVEERDKFYKELSFSGWGGASGHDAPMIAYDALLGAKDNWPELCSRGMFHSGDSDSTAVMAAAWFGALYGFKGVHENLYKKLEYGDRLEQCGKELFKLSHPEEAEDKTSSSCEQNDSPDHKMDKDNVEEPGYDDTRELKQDHNLAEMGKSEGTSVDPLSRNKDEAYEPEKKIEHQNQLASCEEESVKQSDPVGKNSSSEKNDSLDHKVEHP